MGLEPIIELHPLVCSGNEQESEWWVPRRTYEEGLVLAEGSALVRRGES